RIERLSRVVHHIEFELPQNPESRLSRPPLHVAFARSTHDCVHEDEQQVGSAKHTFSVHWVAYWLSDVPTVHSSCDVIRSAEVHVCAASCTQLPSHGLPGRVQMLREYHSFCVHALQRQSRYLPVISSECVHAVVVSMCTYGGALAGALRAIGIHCVP